MTRLTPVYRSLKKHRNHVVRHFHRSHRHAKRLLNKHGVNLESVRSHAMKATGATGLVTSALVGPAYARTAAPAVEKTPPSPTPNHQFLPANQVHTEALPGGFTIQQPEAEQRSLASVSSPQQDVDARARTFPSRVSEIVTNPGPRLSVQQESAVEQLIKDTYGVPAKAELDGIRLNATFGVIAGEQHLPLYPGDTLESHKSDPTKHLTGMVPGLPAWGYFAPSKAQVTEKDIQRERYYIAAQTFLAPGWDQNVNKYYKWFKYRKMVMVNPATGSACVVVIGDAGPSPRLKRAFGGSNEVMIELDLGRKRKGGVYAFFVDDPEDKIPLGPLTGWENE